MPDILVNNAGMNISKPALDTTPEEFNQVLTTNLDAPFFLATEFARPLIEKGQAGRIINIASVGGLKVLPGATPYCVSKSGLVMMTRGLAREWARYDINVNALCPGYIETEINDFGGKPKAGKNRSKASRAAGWRSRTIWTVLFYCWPGHSARALLAQR